MTHFKTFDEFKEKFLLEHTTFLEYLKTDKNITLVIISPEIEDNIHLIGVDRLEKACKKLKINCVSLDSNCYNISDTVLDGNMFILTHNSDIKKNIRLNIADTIAVARKGRRESNYESFRMIIQCFENAGIPVINSSKALELCDNKLLTLMKLKSDGILVPKTILLTPNSDMDMAIKEVGGKFPLILKEITGSKGVGVIKVDSKDSLLSVAQTYWKRKENIILEEMIDIKYDIRTIVVNGEIIGSMKRHKIKTDFRSNYSLGAKVSKYNLSPEEEKIIISAAKSVGCFYCGVDHMVDKKGNIYIIEVNYSPGASGFEKSTGLYPLERLVKYISSKHNWKYGVKDIGYLEQCKCETLNRDIIIRFDTGSRTLNMLYVEDYVMKGKNITFKLDGKSYTMKCDTQTFNAGIVERIKGERPIVILDVEINGKKIPNIVCTVTKDHGKMEHLLLSNFVIKNSGFIINSHKKFSLNPLVEIKKKMKK